MWIYRGGTRRADCNNKLLQSATPLSTDRRGIAESVYVMLAVRVRQRDSRMGLEALGCTVVLHRDLPYKCPRMCTLGSRPTVEFSRTPRRRLRFYCCPQAVYRERYWLEVTHAFPPCRPTTVLHTTPPFFPIKRPFTYSFPDGFGPVYCSLVLRRIKYLLPSFSADIWNGTFSNWSSLDVWSPVFPARKVTKIDQWDYPHQSG